MPIYQHRCESCSVDFEVHRSFSDNSPICCPSCGGRTRRLIAPVAVIFKGPGFYCTDNMGTHTIPSNDTDKAKDKEAPREPAAKSNAVKEKTDG